MKTSLSERHKCSELRAYLLSKTLFRTLYQSSDLSLSLELHYPVSILFASLSGGRSSLNCALLGKMPLVILDQIQAMVRFHQSDDVGDHLSHIMYYGLSEGVGATMSLTVPT